MNASLLQFPSAIVADTDFSRYGFSEASLEFKASKVVDSPRWNMLDRWQKYFECKQHDTKRYDFDGRQLQQSEHGAPLLSSERVPWYVPLKMRRPSTPYRIGKRVVSSFTTMTFGESRWPDITVLGDKDSQCFVNAIAEETGLSTKAIQLRNVGGCTGTAGLSWCYYDGVPTVEVHNGKSIYVHEWADKANLIPSHVTEVYKYEKDLWDPVKKAIVREWFWRRQDWTLIADVMFKECAFKTGQEPYWEVDEENTVVHGDGFAHFIYVQNLPPLEGVDGVPDFEGALEQMDTIDIIVSVLARGGVLNLDPTLKLKMDPELVDHAFVRKGSDNALVTGESGDASYMELSGTSIVAGLSLMKELRAQVLETCECVIPDPDKIAAAGTSSVALKMIYAPMLGKTDLLREQYGKAIRELLRQMLTTAQKLYAGSIQTREVEEGEEEDVLVSGYVKLPPKVVTEDILDEEGNPTGEQVIRMDPQVPGSGSHIELSWGPYFQTTSMDQASVAQSLVQATGGKSFCSRKTAVELFANVVSKDPTAMLDELDLDSNREAQERQALMVEMGDAPGGEVEPIGDETETDEDSTATRVAADEDGVVAPTPEQIKLTLTATDVATFVTVNEGRASQGLGPMLLLDGRPDPDGDLMIAAFKAKIAATIAKASMAEQGMASPAKIPTGE